MRSMLATTRMVSPLAMQRLALRAPRPCAAVVVRSTSSSATAADVDRSNSVELTSAPKPNWDIRLLYDGECPLCLKEINFLRSRNQAGKVVFVDIAAPDYDPVQNAGVTFEQAMATIHGITSEGRIYTGVEVFRLVYEAVGLGWVYAITKNPAVLAMANGVYDVWAKYRTQLTGREALEVLLERRRMEAAGKASCRTPVGVDSSRQMAQKCDV